MNNRPPRVAAIHALAGFGRSSLAVVIPTLSAMGVQVCPIPTAVMSTHTGGLGELVHRDLSDYIYPTVEHYQRLSVDLRLSGRACGGGPGDGGSWQALPHLYP